MTMTANSGNRRRRQQKSWPVGYRGTTKKSQLGATPGLADGKFPLVQAKASTLIAPHLTAFQLLLTFASKRLQVTPPQLTLEQIDAPHAAMDQAPETSD